MINVRNNKLLINSDNHLLKGDCTCDLILFDKTLLNVEYHNTKEAVKRYIAKNIGNYPITYYNAYSFSYLNGIFFIVAWITVDIGGSLEYYNVIRYDPSIKEVTHLVNPFGGTFSASLSTSYGITNDGTDIYVGEYSVGKLSSDDLSTIWHVPRTDFAQSTQYEKYGRNYLQYRNGLLFSKGRADYYGQYGQCCLNASDGTPSEPMSYYDTNGKIANINNNINYILSSSSGFCVPIGFIRYCDESFRLKTIPNMPPYFSRVHEGYVYCGSAAGTTYGFNLKKYDFDDFDQPSCSQIDDRDYDCPSVSPLSDYSLDFPNAYIYTTTGIVPKFSPESGDVVFTTQYPDGGSDLFGFPSYVNVFSLSNSQLSSVSFSHNIGRFLVQSQMATPFYALDDGKLAASFIRGGSASYVTLKPLWKKGVSYKVYSYISTNLTNSDGYCLHNNLDGVTTLLVPKMPHMSGGYPFDRDADTPKDYFVRDRFSADTYLSKVAYSVGNWQTYNINYRLWGGWKPSAYPSGVYVIWEGYIWRLSSGKTKTIDDTMPPDEDSDWARWYAYTPVGYAVDSVVRWSRYGSPYPESYHWICLVERSSSDLLPPDEDTDSWRLLAPQITGDTEGWLRLWEAKQDEPYIGADWEDFWEDIHDVVL